MFRFITVTIRVKLECFIFVVTGCGWWIGCTDLGGTIYAVCSASAIVNYSTKIISYQHYLSTIPIPGYYELLGDARDFLSLYIVKPGFHQSGDKKRIEEICYEAVVWICPPMSRRDA